MIRITSGSLKNKKLKIPNLENFRGVQEISKLAIFSIIGDKIKGAVCLDLYAGSGNLGIEALSRGASWCDFVDESYDATDIIKENLANFGLVEKSEVHCKNSVKFILKTTKSYDVIFADPFYSDKSHVFLFSNIEKILKKDGIFVFLQDKTYEIENALIKSNLEIVTQRKFGQSVFTILKI